MVTLVIAFGSFGFCDFLKIICLFIYFWLYWVFIAEHGLSLVSAGRSYSLAAVGGLLIVVVSLVAEHRLQCMQASVVMAHGLSRSVACGIFLAQGLNLCLLH